MLSDTEFEKGDIPVDTELSSTFDFGERLREGVELFNRGEFFECHEVLEAAWLEAAGAEKKFLQGLIQVAVSFYHLRRGNFPGSSRLLRAGLEKLSRSGSRAEIENLAELLTVLQPLPEQIAAGSVSPDWPAPVIEVHISSGS
jgi:predicted metal-dependent hydrolase